MRKTGTESNEVGYEVPKTSAVKFAVFLDVRPCILLFMYQLFNGPDAGGRGIAGLGDSQRYGRPWQHRRRGEEVDGEMTILIHLLTAIGLTPNGSSTVHSHTKTVHRT